MHPSPRALALCVAGLALAVPPALGAPALWPVWAVAWLLLLLALACDAALSVRSADLRLSATLPLTVAVGTTVHLPLTLDAPADRRPRVELALHVSDHLSTPAPVHTVVTGARGQLAIPLRVLRRGRATVHAAWLRWPGPLGLVLHVRRLPLDVETRAVPDLGAARGQAMRLFGERHARSGRKVERFVGDGTAFHALRDHHSGDDRRAIDWKASARHARLLLREHRAERNHQIVVAVDTGRLMAEPLAGLPRLDHAIHAALALAWVGTQTGDRVGLFAFGARPHAFVTPRPGARGFQTLLAQTADLDYSREETNFTLGLTALSERLARRSLIVVLTDFADSVTAELMLDNLQRLARRHLVLFVALRDPLLGDTVRAPPTDLDAMHRAVVASALSRERERVFGRLRRAGALCVDALPGAVGADLVDRYLHIKRRELI